jgi:DNA-binding MarR family transcriptional regulator
MRRQKPKETRKPFLWIHYLVFDDRRLRASDKVVYMVLARHADNKTQECFPSLEQIAEEAGLSKKTVIRSLKRLNKYGYIEIESGLEMGRPNKYILLEPTRNKYNNQKKETSTEGCVKITPVENSTRMVENSTRVVENSTSNNTQYNTQYKNNIQYDEVELRRRVQEVSFEGGEPPSEPPLKAYKVEYEEEQFSNEKRGADKIPNSFWRELEHYYIEIFEKEHGFKPEISYAAYRVLAKSLIIRFLKKGMSLKDILEVLKNYLRWYVQEAETYDGYSKSFTSPDLKAAFSKASINQYRAYKVIKNSK